jgi:hypothetical protein
MVVLKVLGWTNTAYMENKTRIDPSALSNFPKCEEGSRCMLRARSWNDGTYLRSEDQAFVQRKQPARKKELTPAKKQNVERRTVAVAEMPGRAMGCHRPKSEIKVNIGVAASRFNEL